MDFETVEVAFLASLIAKPLLAVIEMAAINAVLSQAAIGKSQRQSAATIWGSMRSSDLVLGQSTINFTRFRMDFLVISPQGGNLGYNYLLKVV
jgi:hypothetical protein